MSAGDTSLSVSWTAPTGDSTISVYTVSIQKYYGGRSNISFVDDGMTTVLTRLCEQPNCIASTCVYFCINTHTHTYMHTYSYTII